VPIVQRKLIALCRQYGKLCIVATQMMGSMVDNPRPTRAEVSDVATAVLLGTDVVMLSDETANGKYPIETIKEMKKVILYTQANSKIMPLGKEVTGEYKNYDAISQAAVRLAEKIDADLIAVGTRTGATADSIAAQRPNVPMISVSSNPRVAGQLALTYANSSYVRPYTEDYVVELVKELKTNGYLKLEEGQKELTVVFVTGLRDEEGGTNRIEIRKI
jgi:pyruvate kinase